MSPFRPHIKKQKMIFLFFPDSQYFSELCSSPHCAKYHLFDLTSEAHRATTRPKLKINCCDCMHFGDVMTPASCWTLSVSPLHDRRHQNKSSNNFQRIIRTNPIMTPSLGWLKRVDNIQSVLFKGKQWGEQVCLSGSECHLWDKAAGLNPLIDWVVPPLDPKP